MTTSTTTLHLLDNLGVSHPTTPLTRDEARANLRAFNVQEAINLTTDCSQCDRGCDCEGGTPGCGHFNCWGAQPTGSCPSAAAHRTAWRRVYPGMFAEPVTR